MSRENGLDWTVLDLNDSPPPAMPKHHSMVWSQLWLGGRFQHHSSLPLPWYHVQISQVDADRNR